jgi:glycosyltransferase involved in cell wall biosynthesis
MPNTILEAMATGLPVVSTQVGGADELVVHAETGFLVPPVRPDLLADAIGRLVDDPALRARLGAAGRARATGHFSLAAMVGGYEKVYVEGRAPI